MIVAPFLRRFHLLGTDLGSRYAKGAGWLLAGAAAARVAMLGASIGIARLLIPSRLGELTIVQSATMLLGGLAGTGLSVALTRQVATLRVSDPAAIGSWLRVVLQESLGTGLVIMVGYLVLAPLVMAQLTQDTSAADLVLPSAGAVALTGVASAAQGGLNGMEAFGASAAAQMIQGFSTAFATVTGAALGGLQGAVLGISIGSAIAAGGAYAMLRAVLRREGLALSGRVVRSDHRQLWRIAAPASLAFATVSAAILISQVLLAQASGRAQVALFTVAYRWHLAILFIPASVAPVLLPVMTRLRAGREIDRAGRLLRANALTIILLTVGPSLLCIAVAAPILGLSGSFYGHHTIPLVILAIATVPVAINNVVSAASVSVGIIRAWVISDVALAVVVVGVAAVTVAAIGASGLALAYLAGYIATSAYLIPPLRRALRALPPQSAALVEV